MDPVDRARASDLGRLESTLHTVSRARRYHRWLAESIAPLLQPPVLEIGAGLGGFSEALLEFVSPIIVSESEPRLRAVLAKRFAGDSRVRLAEPFVLPILEPTRLAPEPRSLVIANVLEHIDDDVKALECLLSAFPSTRRLLLVVPGHQWAYSPLDRVLGHHRRYSRQSLRNVIEEAGWQCHSIRYFNPVGALAWAASGRLLRRSSISPWQTSVVEAIVPLLQTVDRIAGGKGIGQSLISLASPAS